MITLIQFPWSPFCISIRRILDEHQIPYRVTNVRSHMRDDVIRATHGRAYTVPCLIDGRTAIADFTDFGQEVARHIDRKFTLGLFPVDKEGIQAILARYIENDLESIAFKIDDSYVIPTLPLVERVMLTRFKERKFGKGCVAQWTHDRAKMIRQFADTLAPMDNMLASSEFLVGAKPLFVDYDLYGILGNFLYCGKTKLPPLKNLQRWHRAMSRR
ncbi:MAG TPA: glutathione S-transferase family protein [Verrucomicrobiae bacterium]|nr:glutathione S-transferase family protein [Verrucomicrobiae bacterium]